MDQNLLVGYDSSDDACIYRISDELALVQTVDFFTPVVDDPFLFGQIAAANALSDVYAMGGTPTLAMNILCVPNCLSHKTIRAILEGGHAKACEASCVVAGGHTIQDNEPKYGMCVSGFVHPKRILKNTGAQPGDVLVLTKPIGSGVLTTGRKAGLLSDKDFDAMTLHLATLNAYAAEAAAPRQVHACTDITGFGLLGHCLEMARGSGVTIRLRTGDIPLMSGARELAEMGLIPAGAYRNWAYAQPDLTVHGNIEQALLDLTADPQTSGGLLFALSEPEATLLLDQLRPFAPWSRIIGCTETLQDAAIILE